VKTGGDSRRCNGILAHGELALDDLAFRLPVRAVVLSRIMPLTAFLPIYTRIMQVD